MRRVVCLLAALAAPLSAAAQQIANPPQGRETLPAIVLILPGENTPFGRAAEAVRAGFFAAHAAAGAPMAIETQESDEMAANIMAAIDIAAVRGARIVVGPLTRDAVDALVRAGGAHLPVLALNTPSSGAPLPPSMLALSLRVEDEARSVVHALLREPVSGVATAQTAPFAIVAGSGGLERRAAAAFMAAARENGGRAEMFELSLKQERLTALSQRLAARAWRAILLALNAGEAAALRPWLPAQTTVVATSRVYLIDPSAAGLAQELEGLAFVDMPWLVEPDHPAVMVYPRAATPFTAELERLYALGIDAYRVAAEWLKGSSRFEIDGVTGWLRVDPVLGGRIERSPVMAVFVDGKAERRDVLR
jgi:outer membrane PBP1 activator LpoA protein